MKKQPKEWTEIRQEFDAMQRLSCVPQNICKVSLQHIFDEDKSVKWNKEQVQLNNDNFQKEVVRLNTEKNKLRDSIYDDIYYSIQCEVGHNLSVKKARGIWEYAYAQGGSYGINEILNHLHSLMELVDELLSPEVKSNDSR